MTDQEIINYPDVVGFVTGGPRVNLDVVQCALAARPLEVAAGKPLDLVLLVQNASDIDVDVILHPQPPDRDWNKQKNQFIAKTNRLVVGLRPAEAGFVTLPVMVAQSAAPGAGYLASVKLEVKRMEKRKPQRTRGNQGGAPLDIGDLAEEAQSHLQGLKTLAFSVNMGGKKDQLFAPFSVLPPAIAGLKKPKPGWISLWTMADYKDDYVIAKKVWTPAQNFIRQANRETLFMPLLKATQTNFQACQYPLTAPEAIFVTKIVTLILEMGAVAPDVETPRPTWPRWFTHLCRLLHREPALADHVVPLVTQQLYTDLVYDAILYGFTMISTVTNENFGTPDETSHYADDIVDALTTRKPLDFARAYLPLVLSGLIANARVTMPNEQVRETVFILSKAIEKRAAERSPDNAFIFDTAARLIDRALDVT